MFVQDGFLYLIVTKHKLTVHTDPASSTFKKKCVTRPFQSLAGLCTRLDGQRNPLMEMLGLISIYIHGSVLSFCET